MSSGTEGFLLLNKPRNITSFDALNFIKKAFSTGRVGHSGTLDKFAEGLLIVLVGRATRLVPWFTGCDKIYEGIIEFGKQTDTLDPDGIVTFEASPPNENDLKNILPSFIGQTQQIPPLYSSIHINGRRAHQYARDGLDPELRSRTVFIYDLQLLDYVCPYAKIRIHCSKGTYIRSLARDLAVALNSRAHLKSLKRVAVGRFSLDEAVDIDGDIEIAKDQCYESLRPFNMKAATEIGIGIRHIHMQFINFVLSGKPFEPSWCVKFGEESNVSTYKDMVWALFDTEERFLAIVENTTAVWHYGFVNSPAILQ